MDLFDICWLIAFALLLFILNFVILWITSYINNKSPGKIFSKNYVQAYLFSKSQLNKKADEAKDLTSFEIDYYFIIIPFIFHSFNACRVQSSMDLIFFTD